MTNGYLFYFDTPYGLLTFPITPSELKISNGSNNKVVNLINEGDVNILKSPSLMDIEFEARFPMRRYPYVHEYRPFNSYFSIFTKLKEEKKSFRFIVARSTPKGVRTWDTDIHVSLEDLSTNESADEGDDVIVSFALKQFKEYGVKFYQGETPSKSTSTSNNARDTNNSPTSGGGTTYEVQEGDCLWNIAKMFYGDGTKNKVIYEANKTLIENTAKKYGKASSKNGWWIYPGTVLILPDVNSAEKTKNEITTKANKTKTQKAVIFDNTMDVVNAHELTVAVPGKLYGKVIVSYVDENKKKQTVSLTATSRFMCRLGSKVSITATSNSGYTLQFSVKKGDWNLSNGITCTMNQEHSIMIMWEKTK